MPDPNNESPLDVQIPTETHPESGLPIGPAVDPTPARNPERKVLDGQYCRLEPFDPARHGDELFQASTPADAAQRFQYLFETAPDSADAFKQWMQTSAASEDPLFFAVIDKATGRCEGRQTLMRITPAQQGIEIGNIYWGPAIAGTRVSTEANFLFASYCLDDLGYRRYEWKCNALNAPSRQAAIRFGFQFEGLFRRHMIVRGRTRDTAWFSIISEQWPALKLAYEQWLDPANFDDKQQQKSRLSDLTRAALAT